jgi:beta-glucosidase-like glycosyl hydrolase/CubicO group peptidase (beta-lactamase class C family)
MKKFVIILFAIFAFAAGPKKAKVSENELPYMSQLAEQWADSLMATMTLDEKIGQLFMVAAYSNKEAAHEKQILQLIQQYKIGGLIFMQGGLLRQARLTNQYQAASKIPLMIAMDAEWGLSMRIDSTFKFPKQLTMGALPNEKLIYDMGKEMARQCKRLGVHISFSPVLDINNNPNNPVIGYRSFGEDKFSVALKGIAYMKGLQDGGVLACGKHFPGHGNTETDSHHDLPVVNGNLKELKNLELFPFEKAFEKGLGSVMIAHLYMPEIEKTPNLASTLSPKIVTDLLRNEMKYKGLVFTDALNMQGVAKFHAVGDVELKALMAGNDVLLFSQDVAKAFSVIKGALSSKKITEQRINESCRKILMSKYWMGITNKQCVDINGLYQDLNGKRADGIKHKMAQQAITLVQNIDSLLPLKNASKYKIASLTIGSASDNTFRKTLSNYFKINHFGLDKNASGEAVSKQLNQLKQYDCIILHINNTSTQPSKKYGVTALAEKALSELKNKETKVILAIGGSPYILNQIKSHYEADAILVYYEEDKDFQSYAAQAIFGGIALEGKLPVGAGKFKVNTGIQTDKIRLGYTIPEALNYSSLAFSQIDSIVYEGIREEAFPGCQVLCAKNGYIIFQKNYGYYTYDNLRAVTDTTLYDLASITKIAGSMPLLMYMKDLGYFDENKTLGDYLPELKNSNKGNLNFKNILTHQAGLVEWIPFFQYTLNAKKNYKSNFYADELSDLYANKVSSGIYIHKSITDTIYNKIRDSKLNELQGYKYSDLGFYYYKQIIENFFGKPMDKMIDSLFFEPLGMYQTTYNPLQKFQTIQIAPTEFDKTFRRCIIQGYVHDQGAALLGGVAGHAGLFSNTNDLAKLMHLFNKKGKYGDARFLQEQTVKTFTSCTFCESAPGTNRRALGFDRPVNNPKIDGPSTYLASPQSFGHTGFTGTIAWADPENDLIYIFLSNRTFPDSNNKKINKLNTRQRIQEVLYKAFL